MTGSLAWPAAIETATSSFLISLATHSDEDEGDVFLNFSSSSKETEWRNLGAANWSAVVESDIVWKTGEAAGRKDRLPNRTVKFVGEFTPAEIRKIQFVRRVQIFGERQPVYLTHPHHRQY